MEGLDLDDLLLGEDLDFDIPGEPKKETKHECTVFGPLRNGNLEIMEKETNFKEIPSKVEKFVGRQREVYEVVHNCMNNRLVTIIGLPGIGKTALCKNAIHYIFSRKLFQNGIVFMQLKGYTNCEIFLKKLLTNLIINLFNLDNESKQEFLDANAETLMMKCLQYFKS